jgi:hypothetical protein
MDVGHPEVDHGIVLVFALTVFFFSSYLPGVSQALSIGDSWISEVWKVTPEFGGTGIRPCNESLFRLWVEEWFLVQ